MAIIRSSAQKVCLFFSRHRSKNISNNWRWKVIYNWSYHPERSQAAQVCILYLALNYKALLGVSHPATVGHHKHLSVLIFVGFTAKTSFWGVVRGLQITSRSVNAQNQTGTEAPVVGTHFCLENRICICHQKSIIKSNYFIN